MKKIAVLLFALALTASIAFGTTKAADPDRAWGYGSITINTVSFGDNDIEITLDPSDPTSWGKGNVFLGNIVFTQVNEPQTYELYIRNNRGVNDNPPPSGVWPTYKMMASNISGNAYKIGVYIEHVTPGGMTTAIYSGTLDQLAVNPTDLIDVGYAEDGPCHLEIRMTALEESQLVEEISYSLEIYEVGDEPKPTPP
jgi:hypothetical protein